MTSNNPQNPEEDDAKIAQPRRSEAKPPFGDKRERFNRVRVAETSNRGFGVFATAPIKRRRAVGRVLGAIKPTDFRSHYCVEFGNGALEPDAPYRFLNHSCSPNCEFVEWKIDVDSPDSEPVIELWVHALRDIEAGEELTIDYGWDWESAIPCKCGSPYCRGWICKEEELKICYERRGTPQNSDERTFDS